jgi:uncharacterized RDD family membrane protein YckC
MRSAYEDSVKALKQGRAKDAIRTLSDALVDDPGNFEIRLLLGIAYGEEKDYDASADLLSSALRLQPDHAPAHYGLGMACEGLRKIEAAVVSYRQALRIDPSYDLALNALQRLRPMEAASFRQARKAGTDDEGTRRNAYGPADETGKREDPEAARSGPPPFGPGYVHGDETSLAWGKAALASPLKRWLAEIVDGYVVNILAEIVTAFVFEVDSFPFAGFAIGIAYETYAIYEYGSTWGKYWLDVAVDSVDGTEMTLERSLARALVKGAFHLLQKFLLFLCLTRLRSPLAHNATLLLLMIPALPSLSEVWILFNPKRQAIHDLLAGTIASRL